VAESEDYKRGHDAGGIAERLDSHDRHFAAINGSLADMVRELHSLTLAVQRLADQAVARDATAVTTAAALKAADDARRDKTEQGWAPWQKALAVTAGLVAVAGVIITLIAK
jgi:hypothetical protein